jgi:hypothetical protein
MSTYLDYTFATQTAIAEAREYRTHQFERFVIGWGQNFLSEEL